MTLDLGTVPTYENPHPHPLPKPSQLSQPPLIPRHLGQTLVSGMTFYCRKNNPNCRFLRSFIRDMYVKKNQTLRSNANICVPTQIFACERKHFAFKRRYLRSNKKVCVRTKIYLRSNEKDLHANANICVRTQSN